MNGQAEHTGADGAPSGDDSAGQGRFWLVAILAACAFVTLIGLGNWQVNRLAWKENLVAMIEARMASAPVDLDEAERRYREIGDVDYMPVIVTGRFDHANEQHFFATDAGEAGYFIYTPLITETGRILFVNRGFVRFDMKDPLTRAAGQVAGEVTVTGLARNPLFAKPSSIVPDNDTAANIFYWKDIAAMAARAGLARQPALEPFFVDAGKAPNPGGWPRGGVTIVSLPNNHLQYAITWYGLAAALAGVFGVWSWRRFRP